MKDIMQIVRELKTLNPEEAEKEIFEMIKADKQWLGEIVKIYINDILPDVLAVKDLIEQYLNPPELLDEEPSKNLN